MAWNHIIAAADDSEAGRAAVGAAFQIARQAGGRVSLLHVVAVPVRQRLVVNGAVQLEAENETAQERLRHWLASQPFTKGELNLAFGLPAIEICRFAEERKADLIVVGRKQHSERYRLFLGDTADAVARRNRVPTLFVPPGQLRLGKILVALDGSERGMKVLEQAARFARMIDGSLNVVTVEATPAGEPAAGSPPLTRSTALQSLAASTLLMEGFPRVPVTIRRGNIVEEVLQEIRTGEHDVLAIGHHRGGPAWLVQNSSTAQQLGHAAPCAVLTVPL